uniref:NADH-ubiquinone oxidoreductase chain 3 n=1 Tax=Phycosecis limbata TaxID=1205668 RepID=A0A0S2MR81_9CUCU|nr:NADH deshydrogenase subunit 3 [Phycosecis limbata]
MIKIMFIIATIILMITSILMLLASTISKKTFSDREKNSPFECGFDPKSSSRMPFSLQFFLIAIIFLIFDVEITLFFPMILTLKLNLITNFNYLLIFLLVILLGGLYHEWKQGALNWNF